MTLTIRAKDLMDTKILKIEGKTSVADALQQMIKAGLWSFLVENHGVPEGVVTDRDILRRCVAKGLQIDKVRVQEIMSSPVIMVGPDSSVGEIMETMVQKSIRRVYVVENGSIIGRITQTMIFDDTLNVFESLSSMHYQM